MSDEPKEFLELAENALEDYSKGLEAGISERALFNRLYYAAFYSAKAALVSVNQEPKTHEGTTNLVFTVLYKERNDIEKETAALLADLERLREEADYQVHFEESRDKLKKKASKVQTFVEKMKQVVKSDE